MLQTNKTKKKKNGTQALCASHRHATSGKHQHEVNSRAVQELIILTTGIRCLYLLYEVGIFLMPFWYPPPSQSTSSMYLWSFFPVLSATLICEWKIFITSKQASIKQSNQCKSKPDAISFKWLHGVVHLTVFFFFFLLGKELHVFHKCRLPCSKDVIKLSEPHQQAT